MICFDDLFGDSPVQAQQWTLGVGEGVNCPLPDGVLDLLGTELSERFPGGLPGAGTDLLVNRVAAVGNDQAYELTIGNRGAPELFRIRIQELDPDHYQLRQVRKNVRNGAPLVHDVDNVYYEMQPNALVASRTVFTISTLTPQRRGDTQLPPDLLRLISTRLRDDGMDDLGPWVRVSQPTNWRAILRRRA